METVTLARNAMATRFEIVLPGENPARLRAAGEEALAVIDGLEAQLSLYREGSEISRINSLAAREAVRVSPSVFYLLAHARQLSEESDGAFDITIAPLMRCWGFMGGSGSLPNSVELECARQRVGMQHVILDEKNFTVRFDVEGVMIDLGAIGKGYAIDRAAETLRDAGISSALLHGGTSTVYAIGAQPDGSAWKIAVEYPPPEKSLLATVELRDEALSVSAVWGKFFKHEGKILGHVIDPRSGRPAGSAVMAAVVLKSAAETDALSTALLVLGAQGHEKISQLRPSMKSLVTYPDKTGFATRAKEIVVIAPENIGKSRENG